MRIQSLVIVLSLVLAPTSTHALVSQDDSRFGPSALTYDPATGLVWLDPLFSLARSYNDVSSQFGAGGDFDGYRYATNAEVQNLFVGQGGHLVEDYTPTNTSAVQTFHQYLGVTQSPPDTSIFRLAGLTSTPSTIAGAEYLLQFNIDPETGYGEYRETVISRAVGPTFGGSFLIQVPEPTAALALSGLSTIALVVRRRR